MAAVLGGMTVLQLAQLFSALAGGTAASITIGNAIKAHIAAHPEDLERVKAEQPELAENWLTQMDQLERESGA